MSANIVLLHIASLENPHHVEDLGKKNFQKLVYLIEAVGHIDRSKPRSSLIEESIDEALALTAE